MWAAPLLLQSNGRGEFVEVRDFVVGNLGKDSCKLCLRIDFVEFSICVKGMQTNGCFGDARLSVTNPSLEGQANAA